MMPFYRALTYAGAAVAVPALFLRSLGGGLDPRLGQRLGRISLSESEGTPLWLQAVSVGEVRTAETLIGAVREARPDVAVFLSSTTSSGIERAEGVIARAHRGGGAFAFPLDIPPAIRRVLGTLRPAAYGSVETEIWPGLFNACGERGIPVFVANGSISPRSLGRYRLIAGAVRSGLRALRAACMQSDGDAERILALGAPGGSVIVTGNLKFDSALPDLSERAGRLRADLGLAEGGRVIIAGSTAPGEETIVVEAWKQASREFPGLALIVAPRHRERFDEVARAIEAQGAGVLRRSRVSSGARPAPADVRLLDTMGDLEAAYTLADVAFIGGSLVPRGGQNPIEAARVGVPVLFGPGMDNFREVASALVAAGGAFEVKDGAALAGEITHLLADAGARERAGNAGRGFVSAHAGATRRTMEALARRIPHVFESAARRPS